MAYAKAIRSVDPRIKIIIEGDWSRRNQRINRLILSDKNAHKAADFISNHFYAPWNITKVTRRGAAVDVKTLKERDIWQAWVATPGIDRDGRSVLSSPVLQLARELDWKVAVTEWNWNGWWSLGKDDDDLFRSLHARGLGAAGFIHALMRQGDIVKIGCQSLLLGSNWEICSIHYDPGMKEPAYFFPSGQVTMFYSQHHGKDFLQLEESGVETYRQPFGMNLIQPATQVKFIDALATSDEQKIYFHAINRHFDRDLSISIDTSDFKNLRNEASQHLFEGDLDNTFVDSEKRNGLGWFSERKIDFSNNILKVVLPKRSISIIEFARQ